MLYQLMPFAAAMVAPAPIVVANDPFLSATTYQVDATGQADGTGYVQDGCFWKNVLSYSGGATVTSGKFSFNGTTAYISSPTKTIFAPLMRGTWEVFKAEFDQVDTVQVLASFYHFNSGGHSWRLSYDGPNKQLSFDIASTTSTTLVQVLTYSWTPEIDGTAYDLTWRWTGTELAILINGVAVATTPYSAGFGQGSAVMRLGADDGAGGSSPRLFFKGRFKAFRFTCEYDRTGGAAVYQRHALPLATAWGATGPAATNPANFANVAFLTNFNGSDGATSFTDYASTPATPSFAGNAQLDTDRVKFSTAALLLDGSGDYVALGNKAAFQGTNGNDLVVEGWAYLAADSSGLYTLYSKRPTLGTATEWQIYVTDRRLTLAMWQSGSGVTDAVGIPFPPNRWTYFAVMRIGTSVFINIDGLWLSTGTQTGTISVTSNSLDIGRDRDFGRYWLGSIGPQRIVRGENYLPASNFVPPIAAFATS